MGQQLYKNNAGATLNGTLAIGGTTINLASGQGNRFPSPTGGDYFLLTIYEKNGAGAEINYEVVKVTARTADTLTVVRDFEGLVVANGGTSGGWAYPSAVGVNPSGVVYLDMRYTAYAASNTLNKDDNLASLASAATARTNLGAEASANKDAANGYPSLVSYKITFKTAAGTNASYLTHANTAARTYTFPDFSGVPVMGASALTGLVKGNGAAAATAAVAGTDYQAPIGTISGIAKGNGANALTAATAGTDYAAPGTPTTWTVNQIFGAGVQQAKVAMVASDVNLQSGSYFTKTISGTTSLTVSNVPATGTVASFILDLTNGGSATVNWWTGMKWAGGTAPTLTAAGRDVLGVFTHDGGTTWTGLVLGKDVK